MIGTIINTGTRTLVLVLALVHIVILEPVPESEISNGSNWYPIRLDNWPKQDEGAIVSQTQRFYYVHGEVGDYSQSNPFLRLKSNYFQNGDSLVSDSVALSFKYWSNSGTTHFQSTYDTTKDVLLNQTGQWVESNLQISKNQWSYYEFYNEGNFNFILKDIQVQSVGNEISQSKQPHTSMTSLKSLGAWLYLTGVQKFDFKIIPDIAKTGDAVSKMLQFEGMYGSISSSYFCNWTNIQFKLRLRSIATVFTVNITNELISKTSSSFLGSSKTQYKFTSNHDLPQNLKENFQFGYDPKWDNTKVNVTVYPYIGFALWDFKVDNSSDPISRDSLEQSSKMTIPETGDAVESRHFLVTSSPKDNSSYVNLWIDERNLTHENCFLWVKSSEDMTIDLYLTLQGESYGRKVAQLVGLNDEFCTSTLMYLRLHETFQLTFVFKQNRVDLDEPFLFNLNRAKVSIAHARTLGKGLKGPLDITHYDPVTMSHSPVWWFYNPKMFDYSVVSNSKGAIYVCDMMANCFPYVRNSQEVANKRDNQTVWNFTISEEVKKLLIYSPVIRIYAEDPRATIYIDAPYLRSKESLLERIKARLISSASNLSITNSKESNNKFQISVMGQTRIPLEIPIDEIDLRANVINITIAPIGSQRKRRIHLVSFKLNNQEAVSNIRIDTSLDGDSLVISTDEFISIRPWKLTHDIRTFVIEFQVDGPWAIDLQIEISVKINDHRVTYSRDLWSVLPYDRVWDPEVDIPNERVTIFTPDQPRALILSKWIHSGSGKALNNMNGEVLFRFTSTHPLTKSDIEVSRIVIGTANTYFTQTPMEVNVSPTGTVHISATLKDDFRNHHENQILLSGPFRVGYLVEMKVNASELTLNFLPKIDRFPAFDQKNCDKGPTYGDLDCHSEVYHCPEHYFTERTLWGGGYECVRVRLPQLMHDLCDPFIGCANIFDRPLPSSANYTNDARTKLRGNAYFPPSLNKQSHLRVRRPASHHNTSHDFCVTFDYIAYQSELIVTDSLTKEPEDSDGFKRHNREWHEDTVCASKFDTHVEEFYFYFVPLLSGLEPSVVGGDIAQHMIANLRYVIVTVADG